MIEQKIMGILQSVRFWMVSAAALFQILKSIFPAQAEIWDILSVWLATVTAIGTADSLVEKSKSVVNVENVEKATVDNATVNPE